MSLKVPSVRASFEADLALQAVSEAHLPLIRAWLETPPVARWWSPPDEAIAEIEGHATAAHIAPFLILEVGRPIGYLQVYHANPDPFWQAHALPVETFGLDLFLGEADALGRGLGTRAIRLALAHLRKQPNVARIQIDPSPDNEIAIRAYAKCGFRPQGTIDTPDGPAAYMILEIPAMEQS
jgi:aminoglycoside 6'-N-acetyltransferase